MREAEEQRQLLAAEVEGYLASQQSLYGYHAYQVEYTMFVLKEFPGGYAADIEIVLRGELEERMLTAFRQDLLAWSKGLTIGEEPVLAEVPTITIFLNGEEI